MNCLLKFFTNLASSVYQSILKLSINANQLIAYWRTRIRREQSASRSSCSTNILSPQQQQTTNSTIHRANNNILLLEPSDISAARGDTEQNTHNNDQATTTDGLNEFKTPHQRRTRLFSILRRLSIRNFMDYCVTALNEASSSSCSNKFDLATCEGAVWLLGRQYNLPQDADELVNDIRSKIWITYRKNFPPIDDNLRYTTDRGFGCMIRCGQMVLANALLYKSLSRDWRWQQEAMESNPDSYIKILKLFQDKEESLYSIHNIVQSGQHEGKSIGEWFGPNTIAQALKRISNAKTHDKPSDDKELLISIDAALDNVVVIDEIKSRFKCQKPTDDATDDERKTGNGATTSVGGDTPDKQQTGQWLPGVLFIQLRLGLTKMNPLYFNALRKTFKFKNSLGIIGGRPNHALYLIGYTEDDIIYLDPHSTQQFIDFDSQSNQDELPEDLKSLPLDSTYHCACPEKMNIDRLDPSLALCFYFQDEQEFDEWCKQSEELLIKSEQAPMFEITPSRPTGWNASVSSALSEEFEMLG